VDEDICSVFAKERGRLRREGSLIGDFDLLIASTCLSHDLTLLTNNVRHFERVNGLRFVSLLK
jgi:tRNA(fMet)-specific endonuclease VapC